MDITATTTQAIFGTSGAARGEGAAGREPAARPFDALTLEQQKAHFADVATRALALWGWPADATLKLLNITENATYKVSTPDRDPMVMRVHRLDYASRSSIECELAWIEELSRVTDLNLARPLPGLDGKLVQRVATPAMREVRNVVCFSYATGAAPVDSTDDTGALGGVLAALGVLPNALTFPLVRLASSAYDRLGHEGQGPSEMSEQDAWLYRSMGRAAGLMRRAAMDWVPKHEEEVASRIAWDWDATFGEGWNNYYGKHYWDADSTLTHRDVLAVNAARDLIRKRLAAFGTSPERYGLVHSDLRMGNLLVDGQKMTVLDFDDCGMGWYLFDIAGMVGFMEHRGDLKAVVDKILEGYEEAYPLSEDERREIPTFILMRRIGLLQALQYHIGNAEPGSNEATQITPDLIAFYARGTAVLARRYLRDMSGAPLAAPAEG